MLEKVCHILTLDKFFFIINFDKECYIALILNTYIIILRPYNPFLFI
jgi:hypothetical protein